MVEAHVNQFTSISRSLPDGPIRGAATRTHVTLPAFQLDSFEQKFPLILVETRSRQTLQILPPGNFVQKDSRAGLADLVENIDCEAEKADMKAGRIQSDIAPMSVAMALIETTSLTILCLAHITESLVKWAVHGRESVWEIVVETWIRDLNVRLLLDFLIRIDAKLQRPYAHGNIIHHLLLWVLPRIRPQGPVHDVRSSALRLMLE
jgi:hypothetical protein